MTAERSAVIECWGLKKHYGGTQALIGVDLRVDAGSIFGFLGPNGAGKSTLVKILTGLVRPSEGRVEVVGGRPGARAVQRRLGYLPEHFRFPSWLTGRELLHVHGGLAGTDPDGAYLLELVGLTRAADRRIGGYSKAMQQRLGLAQALVGDPELLFLDRAHQRARSSRPPRRARHPSALAGTRDDRVPEQSPAHRSGACV